MNIPLAFVLGSCLALVSCQALDNFSPYDDTDPPGDRSGLRLFTDHKTGCQYLSAGLFGGIVPRLDGKGQHVGCHKEPQARSSLL